MLSLWANWLQLNSQLNSTGVSIWLYRRYVRAKMIMHAFIIELDQRDYWLPRKEKEKYMYNVNGELFSCDITDSGRVPSREGDIQNFA